MRGTFSAAWVAVAPPAGAETCVGIAAGADVHRAHGSWMVSAQGRHGDWGLAYDHIAIDGQGAAEGLPAYQRTWAATLVTAC